jgi:hypothetical protein
LSLILLSIVSLTIIHHCEPGFFELGHRCLWISAVISCSFVRTDSLVLFLIVYDRHRAPPSLMYASHVQMSMISSVIIIAVDSTTSIPNPTDRSPVSSASSTSSRLLCPSTAVQAILVRYYTNGHSPSPCSCRDHKRPFPSCLPPFHSHSLYAARRLSLLEDCRAIWQGSTIILHLQACCGLLQVVRCWTGSIQIPPSPLLGTIAVNIVPSAADSTTPIPPTVSCIVSVVLMTMSMLIFQWSNDPLPIPIAR